MTRDELIEESKAMKVVIQDLVSLLDWEHEQRMQMVAEVTELKKQIRELRNGMQG